MYCVGTQKGQNCTQSSQCRPGTACQEDPTDEILKCLDVLTRNETCSAGQVCTFGTTCYNSVCTQYGSVKVGTYINLPASELRAAKVNFLNPKASNGEFPMSDMYLCESYFAAPIPKENDNPGFTHVCAYDYKLNITNRERTSPNLDCNYTRNIIGQTGESTDFNVTQNVIPLAQCGYNEDNSFYCPEYRDE